MSRAIPSLLLLSSLMLLFACGGGGPGAGAIRLAVGFQPAALASAEGEPWGAGPYRLSSGSAAGEGHGLFIGVELARADWAELEAMPGVWVAPRPVGNVSWLQPAGSPVELLAPGRSFVHVPLSAGIKGRDDVAPGSFAIVLDEVFLRLAPDEEPPPLVTYRVLVERGHVDGAAEPAFRVALGNVVADGLPVWPGSRERVSFAGLAGPSALRVVTASIAVRAASTAAPDTVLGRVRFRVLHGGEPLLDVEQEVRAAEHLVVREVALPEQARAGELAFEVEGDPALCAFLEPVLGPVEPDPVRARPDVVLLLLDTFRADNLSAYDGALHLTPNLDALAADSLLFRRAWAPAVWTLPSQTSMLSGIWPPQHGVMLHTFSIPREIVTIAERFAAAGYRTGAVTDGVLVSRRHGFEQGFQWFDEEWDDEFDGTVGATRRFLGRGDGRPTFLFVQTYRAHRPYRVSEATRREHGARLGIEADFDAVLSRLEQNALGWVNGEGKIPPELDADVQKLRALYHGGVIDLDRGVGELLEVFDEAGLRSHGYLLVTADHGEAFGEHELLWHMGGVWEEQIRIPLFVSGPDIAPGIRDHPASLVDVPVTLAALANLAAGEGWDGVPLLSLADDRPAFSFECGPREGRAVALVSGGRKVIAPHDPARLSSGESWHAFDLGPDPGESRDLRGSAADFSAAVLDELRPRLERLLEPRYAPPGARIGPEDVEQLQQLGYTHARHEGD